jgi:hypothetical protein
MTRRIVLRLELLNNEVQLSTHQRENWAVVVLEVVPLGEVQVRGAVLLTADENNDHFRSASSLAV